MENLTLKNAGDTSKIISAYIAEIAISKNWSDKILSPIQVSNYMLIALKGDHPDLYIRPTNWLVGAWACAGLSLQNDYCQLAIEMKNEYESGPECPGSGEHCSWLSNTGQCSGCSMGVMLPLPDWRGYF